MSPEPTVFVIDDDSAMLDSLRWLIESMGLRVRTFATPREFLAEYEPHDTGCLVLDIRMPGMSGLDLQEELLRRSVHLPIVFITAHGDVPTTVRALKKGAVDFLEKPFKDQDLLDCIHRAIEQDSRNRRERAQIDAIQARIARLTAREREVLELVVTGKPNKIIASELGVTTKTVEAHRARVMEKMRARSVAELVRFSVLGIQENEDDRSTNSL